MYSDYVSAHARVLEATRTARRRAMAEQQVPENEYNETCTFHTVPATVLWVHADTGSISALCTEHLRTGLEQYNSETSTHPPVIVPLRRKGGALCMPHDERCCRS